MLVHMNAAQRIDLLDPYEVAGLGGIEFVSRGVVEGFLSGLHRSPFHGFSVEFAEHRPYQPGDELRHIDWKMLARSDRLMIKQFEAETNLRCMVVLDCSASMDWSGAEMRLTKLEYAKRLAAAFAHIMLTQRDATGFISFAEKIEAIVPARSRRQQWSRIVRAIGDVSPGGGTAAEPALRRVTDFLSRRGLVVFISDFLLEKELVLKALQFLRHRGHQVLAFHIMDPGELHLEGPPEARFIGMENDGSIVARPRELRVAYNETVSQAITQWRSACRSGGIAYHHVTTDTPFGHALRLASARSASVK